MKRQIKLFVAVLIAVMMAVPTMAAKKKTTAQEPDRKVWADLCYKISRPVLENMSKGNFQKDFVLELREKHDATIIITTHDMHEAERLCDRIAFIENGRLAVEGSSAEVARRVGNSASLEEAFLKFSASSLDIFYSLVRIFKINYIT